MIPNPERFWLIVLIANISIIVLYLVWGLLIRPRTRRGKEETIPASHYWICAVIMFVCPGVGAGFFAVSFVLLHIFFHGNVDLEDVIFSKERVVTHMKADEERDFNMVPLEEAIAISDTASLRQLMMNVIKGDIQKSLAAIALALNSSDSETSHYAASVLRDELNDFRVTVQKIYVQIGEDDENQMEYIRVLLDYMNSVLEQKVFTNMEQKNFVQMMSEVGGILYRKNPKDMPVSHYEWICLRLLEIEDYADMAIWCERVMEVYPNELASYTCRLKLYFTTQQQDAFFTTMNQLKESKIVIDRETLELIRTFS